MALILVVDDDVLVRQSLQHILHEAGHEVCLAQSGEEALKMFSFIQCSLIITDIVMPGINGLDALATMRKQRPGVKIIAISGGGRSSNMNLLNAAALLGADETVAKPFDPDALVAMVGKLTAAQ
jgi:CheY-like chemotaxis protein